MSSRYPNDNQSNRSGSTRRSGGSSGRQSSGGSSRQAAYRSADAYDSNRQRSRQSGGSSERQAVRARQRKETRRIRIATIIVAVLLIAIIVVVIVACSHKKPAASGSGQNTAPTTTSGSDTSGGSSTVSIPTEYVEATVYHDDIEVTDEYPVQGTDDSYSIHVNTALNATTVYDSSGNPVRVLACSTGRRDGHETPEGTFTLGEWIIDWCYMADGSEGLHAYRIIDGINNDIMFHSVPYNSTDRGDLEYEEYNKLGDYASMGCIRMCVADCRWLGELCATGTEVVIYYDENEQLPMEKPESIRIPTEFEQVRGWDPTDPISENPWHTYTINMEVPNSVTVIKDADYAQDPILAEVTATDNYGNDLSNYVTYTGFYDNTTEGVYTVRVTCDVGPSHAYKDVYVEVK